MACALTKATSRRRLQRWQPIRPQGGTSPRRLRQSLTGLKTRWRLVGDSSLRWLRRRLLETSRVSGESPEIQTCRNVSSVSLVSSRSRRRRGDVSDTCWRLENVSPKNIEHVSISRDSPETPQETSRRRRGDVSATSEDSSRQLVAT